MSGRGISTWQVAPRDAKIPGLATSDADSDTRGCWSRPQTCTLPPLLVLYRLSCLMPPRLPSQRLLTLNSFHTTCRSPPVAHTRSLVTCLSARQSCHGKGRPRTIADPGPSVRRLKVIRGHWLIESESLPCLVPAPGTQGSLPGAGCQERCFRSRHQEDLLRGASR